MIQTLKKSAAAFLLILITALPLAAQNNEAGDSTLVKVTMVIMIVWIGIAAWLFRLDRKIRRVERDIDEL